MNACPSELICKYLIETRLYANEGNDSWKTRHGPEANTSFLLLLPATLNGAPFIALRWIHSQPAAPPGPAQWRFQGRCCPNLAQQPEAVGDGLYCDRLSIQYCSFAVRVWQFISLLSLRYQSLLIAIFGFILSVLTTRINCIFLLGPFVSK